MVNIIVENNLSIDRHEDQTKGFTLPRVKPSLARVCPFLLNSVFTGLKSKLFLVLSSEKLLQCFNQFNHCFVFSSHVLSSGYQVLQLGLSFKWRRRAGAPESADVRVWVQQWHKFPAKYQKKKLWVPGAFLFFTLLLPYALNKLRMNLSCLIWSRTYPQKVLCLILPIPLAF